MVSIQQINSSQILNISRANNRDRDKNFIYLDPYKFNTVALAAALAVSAARDLRPSNI